MTIKVIVELHAKPGKRSELKSLLEGIVANQGPGQSGFLGSTRYEVLDDPAILVEIADWESAKARLGWLRHRRREVSCQCTPSSSNSHPLPLT
jgi:Antibiotic biosynthesis monooxygenase